jgi:hypothetical protein
MKGGIKDHGSKEVVHYWPILRLGHGFKYK